MEAKVDLRKLQLLNDRINQTIDALNQVRVSVHGLTQSATTATQQPPITQQAYTNGAPQFPTPQYPGAAFVGQVPSPQPFMGQTAWGQTPVGYGLQHATAIGGLGPMGALPGVLGPGWIGVGMTGGLAHSSIETEVERQIALQRACDPSRVAVTFPYAFSF